MATSSPPPLDVSPEGGGGTPDQVKTGRLPSPSFQNHLLLAQTKAAHSGKLTYFENIGHVFNDDF
jgi:hypothetical protein